MTVPLSPVAKPSDQLYARNNTSYPTNTICTSRLQVKKDVIHHVLLPLTPYSSHHGDDPFWWKGSFLELALTIRHRDHDSRTFHLPPITAVDKLRQNCGPFRFKAQPLAKTELHSAALHSTNSPLPSALLFL